MQGPLASTIALALALTAGCGFSAPDGAPPNASPDAGGQQPDSAPGPDAQAGPRCSPAYNYDYNGHKYRLIESGMSWLAAKSACEADRGYLLKIDTAEEDQRAEDAFLFGPEEVWMGLRDENNDGSYFWTDGTPPSAFSNWDGGPPSMGNADCVVKNTYGTNGRWYTRGCTDNKAVICECEP